MFVRPLNHHNQTFIDFGPTLPVIFVSQQPEPPAPMLKQTNTDWQLHPKSSFQVGRSPKSKVHQD